MNTENLWNDSKYSKEDYISEPFDLNLLDEIESELGYKLPSSYVQLMKEHNGGLLTKTACPCDTPTSWASDHVGISGIFGIGKDKSNSLCGTFGSKFWIEHWEYPDIGVAICDCPSAGHDMIFLDYRECGKDGEPKVVHVDQEFDYKITVLAENFEEFINKLRFEEEFDNQENKPVNSKKDNSTSIILWIIIIMSAIIGVILYY